MEGDRKVRYSKYDKLSMAELRRQIDKEVGIFNSRLDKWTSKTRTKAGRIKKENEYSQFAKKLEELQSYTGTRRDKTGLGKGYSMRIDTDTGEVFSIKTDRARAIEFLENIHMTNAWDVYTKEGKEKWENARTDSYNTFQARYGDISRADYDNLVDVYNNLGSGILQLYGSDQVKEDYDRLSKEYDELDSYTFENIVKEVVENARGMQQYQMSDEVARRIAKMFGETSEAE